MIIHVLVENLLVEDLPVRDLRRLSKWPDGPHVGCVTAENA